ncbi:MAG: hypothetical protein ACJ76H_05955 [Bacteriovoracaceae bacterium]
MKYRSTTFVPVKATHLATRTVLYNSLLVAGPELLEQSIFTPQRDGEVIRFVEHFDPSWRKSHLGMGRHLSLPPFQTKGVGVTIPSLSHEFGEAAGNLGLADAIKSFILANLLDASLPAGCVYPVSVQQRMGQDEKHLGVLTRLQDGPRLSAIGPTIMEDEKRELLFYLREKFRSDDFRGIQKQVMASYASLAYLTGLTNATPDNLLLDGRCVDEESIFWPDYLGKLALYLEVHWENGDEGNWAKARVRSSSFSEAESAIKNTLRAFTYLLGPEVLSEDDAFNAFYEHLEMMTEEVSLTSIWKQKLPTENLSMWMKEKEADGWEVTKSEGYGDNLFGVNLTRPLAARKDLGDQFNRIQRTTLQSQVQKLLNLAGNFSSPLDASSLSDALFTWIGWTAYYVPVRSDGEGRPVPNRMSASSFWEETFRKWPALVGEKIRLHAWNGTGEISLRPGQEPQGDIIPVFFEVENHHFHAMKTIITSQK